LLNEVKKIEQSDTINTLLYKRTGLRNGYVNGFKNNIANVKVDKITPDLREVSSDVES